MSAPPPPSSLGEPVARIVVGTPDSRVRSGTMLVICDPANTQVQDLRSRLVDLTADLTSGQRRLLEVYGLSLLQMTEPVADHEALESTPAQADVG